MPHQASECWLSPRAGILHGLDPCSSGGAPLIIMRGARAQVTTFSGWSRDLDTLGDFAAKQRASGGDGDGAEAAKTAAAELLKEATKPCVVVW